LYFELSWITMSFSYASLCERTAGSDFLQSQKAALPHVKEAAWPIKLHLLSPADRAPPIS
jgi:hypothetical protein